MKMKIFHTADWHLGKNVHGASMIDEQKYILNQFIDIIREENPDVIIIAGDLYDRAIPAPDAVELLNSFLDEVVLSLHIPVIAIAGNHDSPSRLHFGSKLMREKGFFIVGQLEKELQPIILHDEAGEVHFHLVPFADPSVVRHLHEDDAIKTFDDAMKAIVHRINETRNDQARHVFIGHAFVTPQGKKKKNTSDSERVLSIGGVEYVNAEHFRQFHYVALGHLHQAHFVQEEHIRYAGSPLKYSISEEHHKKGFYIVHLDEEGLVDIEKRLLTPRRNMRTVEGEMEDILQMEPSEDYVFVKLLNRSPVLSPMEKVRAIFPNALHLERPFDQFIVTEEKVERLKKKNQTDLELFTAFYEEVRGYPPENETINLFKEVMEDLIQYENELIMK